MAGKVRLNKKTIGRILKTVDGGKRAVAQKILANIDGPTRIEVYTTDREVVGIMVPADRQARDGVATRAASAVGISPGKP